MKSWNVKLNSGFKIIQARSGKSAPFFMILIISVFLFLGILGSAVIYNMVTWREIPAVVQSSERVNTVKSGIHFNTSITVEIDNKKSNQVIATKGEFSSGDIIMVYYDGKNVDSIFYDNNIWNNILSVLGYFFTSIVFSYIYYKYTRFTKLKVIH